MNGHRHDFVFCSVRPCVCSAPFCLLHLGPQRTVHLFTFGGPIMYSDWLNGQKQISRRYSTSAGFVCMHVPMRLGARRPKSKKREERAETYKGTSVKREEANAEIKIRSRLQTRIIHSIYQSLLQATADANPVAALVPSLAGIDGTNAIALTLL